MQEAFLVASGGRAMLLPRIRPISEDEEELTLLSGLAADVAIRPEELELPPAVSEIERRIALTMLVSKWSQSKRRAQAHPAGDMATVAGAAGDTPAKAANLAADLCRLMDMVETEDKDFSGLAELVPEEFSEHWQQTIEFLKIITEAWPAHLAERGLLSPVGRRNRAILAEAERLATAPPPGPVIVAGVTGSIPATVALMRAVARLPKGAIVLPGLDPYLDEESWQTIVPADASEPGHPEHPQFGLKKLLDRLELKREDVRALGDAKQSVAGQGRAELMAEAMRPSGTTAKWYGYTKRANRAKLRSALDGVSLIEAPSAQDEAEVVSLILREAAETPGRTAALDLARPAACAPRRYPAGSLGHPRRRFRRPPVRQNRPRNVPRPRDRCHRAGLRTGRRNGAAQASADAPRARAIRGPPRRARARDFRFPRCVSRPGRRRHQSGARAGRP